MNYLLKSKPKKSYATVGAVVAVCIVLLASAFIFPTLLRRVSYTVAKPVWVVRDSVIHSADSIKNFFTFKSTLVAQNKSLQDKISTLALKQADYDVLFKENQDLKAQLGRSGELPRTLSRILSKPPRSPYDTFIIDVGSADGIMQGNRVYLSGNVIIGLVTDVTPHTSLVTLFSSSDQKQEATLERTGTNFELSGKGGANLQVEVPKDTDVLWGDTFVYPLLSPAVIGTVYYIDTASQSSFKTIFIRIPGNVFSASWVFVEKNTP